MPYAYQPDMYSVHTTSSTKMVQQIATKPEFDASYEFSNRCFFRWFNSTQNHATQVIMHD